jgi:hypothetical protein
MKHAPALADNGNGRNEASLLLPEAQLNCSSTR